LHKQGISIDAKGMARTLDSPRHDALRLFLVEKRKKAGLRQVDLAKLLKRRQDYVSYVETGHKLVEVVELMEWAEAIGFDPRDAIPSTFTGDRNRRSISAAVGMFCR
jgi:transcriptional regulator with XRE-family HTH domain